MFPLSVFPSGSLSSSVITTVWVGIWVVCFFNLRLGWVFSGLVIPGYLVPLILVRPLSAGVIVVEALLTYALVYAFSESSPRIRKWSSLFGRDRFFALVIMSIVVRLFSEAWLVPILSDWILKHIDGIAVLESDLNGYGLIVTSLIANQMWKPGVRKGFVPFCVCIGLTWWIVRYGLMQYTNFSISNLAFMYEDIAASLEAAPKAYIILLVAAFMASRLNLKYGWEFNGILIPSLLALQWYQPMKVVTTFVECFFIYGLSSIALKLPLIRDINMEGARKFLLFFNIGFIYKLGLAHFLVYYWPTFKSSDAFGYGYMLSTLLAVKMHDKGILLKMTQSTLKASFVSVIWASLIGYGLNIALVFIDEKIQSDQLDLDENEYYVESSLEDWMKSHKLSLKKLREPDSIEVPNEVQISQFEKLLRYLDRIQDFQQETWLPGALKLAEGCGYQIQMLEEGIVVLVEAAPIRGWGSFLLKKNLQNSFGIQVLAPMEEWSVLESGVELFKYSKASTLVVAGAGRTINRDGSSDMLTQKQSYTYAFSKIFSDKGVVQVRGLGAEYLKREKGVSKSISELDQVNSSELLVYGDFPESLSLGELDKLYPGLVVRWDRGYGKNIHLAESQSKFLELYLSRTDRRRMLFMSTSTKTIKSQKSMQMISGYLTDLLLDTKAGVSKKGSGDYIEPKLEDLLYFDEEVLTPLVNVVRSKGLSNQELEQIYKAIHSSAQLIGYELSLYQHQSSGEEYLILSEELDGKRSWGTLVLHLGRSSPYHIEVPRPLSEIYTLETGTRWFQNYNCEALIIAGAHALTNVNGVADPLKRGVMHPFTLMQQVLLRETAEEERLVVQLRALSADREKEKQKAVFASHKGWLEPEQMSSLSQNWLESLVKDGLSVELWKGNPIDFGGNPWNTPQARYLNASSNKDFYQLWLPMEIRQLYKRQDRLRFEEKIFSSLNIGTSSKYLLSEIVKLEWMSFEKEEMDVELEYVNQFLATRQNLYLWKLLNDHHYLKIHRIVDLDSKRTFLMGMSKYGNYLRWVVRLDSLNENVTTMNRQSLRKDASDFMNSVNRWLVFESVQL